MTTVADLKRRLDTAETECKQQLAKLNKDGRHLDADDAHERRVKEINRVRRAAGDPTPARRDAVGRRDLEAACALEPHLFDVQLAERTEIRIAEAQTVQNRLGTAPDPRHLPVAR